MHLRRPQHKVGAGAGSCPGGFLRSLWTLNQREVGSSGGMFLWVLSLRRVSREPCVSPVPWPTLSHTAWPWGSPCRAWAAPELLPPASGLARHPVGQREPHRLGEGKGRPSLPRFPLFQFITMPEQGAWSPRAPEAGTGGFWGLFETCRSHPFLHCRKNTWWERGKINCLLNCLLILLFQKKKHNCKHGEGIEHVLIF